MKVSNLNQGYYFGVSVIHPFIMNEWFECGIFSEYLLNIPFHTWPLEGGILKYLGGKHLVTEFLLKVTAEEIWLEMSIILVTKMLLSVP